MKKIDALIWGIKHIGGNHHSSGTVYTEHDSGDMVLYTRTSVPSIHDVQMLAADMGVSQHCAISGYIIQITLPKEWVDTIGQQEFVPSMGMMMWKRTAIPLGAHLGYLAEEYDPFYERSGWFYRHYDTFEQAKEACDTQCSRTRNGNLYSVWEVAMGEGRNIERYVCQWSNAGKLEDITAQELARQEQLRQERERIIAEL